MEAVVALLGTLMVAVIVAVIGVYVFVQKIASNFAVGLQNINTTLNSSLSAVYDKVNNHIAEKQIHGDSKDVMSRDLCEAVQKTQQVLIQSVKATQLETKQQIEKMDTKLDTVLEKLGKR